MTNSTLRGAPGNCDPFLRNDILNLPFFRHFGSVDMSRYLGPRFNRTQTCHTLSPSTPLHTAIGKGNISMVKYLGGEGFSVNVFPLASVKCFLNPIMATIVIAPDKKSAYEALAIFADHTIRSKIFNIRILRLAIATHSLQLIQRVEADSPLSSAGTATFNYTLLHIACLRGNESQIISRYTKIHQSIHGICLPPRRINNLDSARDKRPFVSMKPSSTASEVDEVEASAKLATASYLLSPNRLLLFSPGYTRQYSAAPPG